MEEMLGMAREALREKAALGIGDRIVLSGGGARLRGAVELAEQVFEAPARLAAPDEGSGWREAVGDPACCTALGLVEYAARRAAGRSRQRRGCAPDDCAAPSGTGARGRQARGRNAAAMRPRVSQPDRAVVDRGKT
jgi:cell division ATPase FtsA